MPSTNTTDAAAPSTSCRWWSPVWAALLVPCVFLPYRFLFLPCALAAILEAWPRAVCLRERLRKHGTLIIGAPVVLVLRTALDPAWWAPWIAFAATVGWLSRNPTTPTAARRFGVLLLVSIWVAAIAMLWRPTLVNHQETATISPEAVLVCVGDSLTSGVTPGSDADTYVASLRSRLPCSVVNAGIANDKTRDVLRRLDRDVLAKKPDVVLLFVGGNDSLDGTPRAAFAEDLETAAARIAGGGARLVLVEVPAGIVLNPYAGLYRRVAAKHGAILVPESRLRLWFSAELLVRDRLKDPLTIDGIHLSPSGAKRVADWLEPYVRASLSQCAGSGR